MQRYPSYFPSNYFDPYQVILRPPMMIFPHPHPPPPIFGGSETMNTEVDLPPTPDVEGIPTGLFEDSERMPAGYPPQYGSILPVETMSGNLVLETKPGEITKETNEEIGISIGEMNKEGEGQQVDMNSASNSTQYIPPNGTEGKPDLPDEKATPPSKDEDDGRKIKTDSSGKYVINDMKVKVKNKEAGQDLEMDFKNQVVDDEEAKAKKPAKEAKTKTRGKRDADNWKPSLVPVNAKVVSKPEANSAKRTPTEKLEAKVEGEIKPAVSTDKTKEEQGKKIVAQDKESGKEDKKQEAKDKKVQKKPKKKPDPDALSERKVVKALGQLDGMLDSMSKDPFGAIGGFFSHDKGIFAENKGLFSDSIFGV